MNKINKSIIITSIIFLLLGFGIAYLVFGIYQEAPVEEIHSHDHEESSVNDEIWTCSMHPQIRQGEPGDCPICGMDLILLDENASSDPLILEMTTEAIKLANIQTTQIGDGSERKEKTIKLSGKIHEDERLVSSQVSHVPGRIEKMYINFTGEKVKKGQKVADIYAPDLINAQRELLEAFSFQEINPGLLTAARKKLQYWRIGSKMIQDIEESGQIIENFPLLADHNGIISKRRVSVGDYVKQGESLFDVMNLSRVWVLFDVYEEDLPFIQMGDKISFTTPSIPGKEFHGKISFIDPLINPQTRTVSVRTELVNIGGKLKPEMLVYGSLRHRLNKNTALTVPKTAILWTGTRSVAYVKVPDLDIPSFEFREIELGESLGDSYYVKQGLEAGEEVVTYGNFAIDAAAQLNNQASMMNRLINNEQNESGTDLPDFTISTPMAFKEQLAIVTEAYLTMKDAFVDTDKVLASKHALMVVENLNRVDMSLVKGDAHVYWMEQLKALEAHSSKIAESQDIEVQRKQFDFISQALIKSIKVFGIPKDSLYVQHCPMAIGKDGANWISGSKEIRNPYFGDQMLKCGSVTHTIYSETESNIL